MWPTSAGPKTRRPALKGAASCRGGGPRLSHSWQLPEMLPVQLTSPGPQAPRAGLGVADSGMSVREPSCPPQHSSGRAPCTCQYLKLKARCSSSTQLGCATEQTTQAGFMREEAPISSPLAGVKRSYSFDLVLLRLACSQV